MRRVTATGGRERCLRMTRAPITRAPATTSAMTALIFKCSRQCPPSRPFVNTLTNGRQPGGDKSVAVPAESGQASGMSNCKYLTGFLGLITVICLSGCASSGSHHALEQQTGESVVLVGEAPANLAFAPLLSKPVTVRSTYRDGLPQTIHYQPGQDYLLDAVRPDPADTGLAHSGFRHQHALRQRGFPARPVPRLRQRAVLRLCGLCASGEVGAAAGEGRVRRGAAAEDAAEAAGRREGAHRGVWGQHHGGRGRLGAGLDLLGTLGGGAAGEVSARQY